MAVISNTTNQKQRQKARIRGCTGPALSWVGPGYQRVFSFAPNCERRSRESDIRPLAPRVGPHMISMTSNVIIRTSVRNIQLKCNRTKNNHRRNSGELQWR